MGEWINKGELNMEMSSFMSGRLGSCLVLGDELSSHIQLRFVSGASLSIWKTKLYLILSIRAYVSLEKWDISMLNPFA